MLKNSYDIKPIKSHCIKNINQLNKDSINSFNIFIKNCITSVCKKVSIQSYCNNKVKLHNLIEALVNVFPCFSGLIELNGFKIDSISLKQVFESIYNAESFSLTNWWIDIKSDLKLDVSSEYKIKTWSFLILQQKIRA